MLHINDEVKAILELSQALANEKYYYKLFDLTLDGCMKCTGADAGFFYGSNNGKLHVIIAKNKTLEAKGRFIDADDEDEIDMNPRNMVALAVAHRKIMRIDDVYEEKNFEILKLKEFDVQNDYRTKSVMIIPIIDSDNRIDGVLELRNCTNDAGEVIPFPEEYEILVRALTSQMATTMSNMMLIQELQDLLDSFVESMTTAIDERTPYNANHSRNVAQLCEEFSDFINEQYTKGNYRGSFINDNQMEQLRMAARLHDIGKMITPREVLNKSTRLGAMEQGLINKLEKIQLNMKIDMLEKRMDQGTWAMEDMKLANFISDLKELNTKSFLTDEDLYRINEMSKKVYIGRNLVKIPYLNAMEKEALNIQKGTLTAKERELVQEHVVYTDKMLAQIKFNKMYGNVRDIAAKHHEYIDGTGYPNSIKGDKLDTFARILTITDIYDSLTSEDRPYKAQMPISKALSILDEMVKEGKLDRELIRIFTEFINRKEEEKAVAMEVNAELEEESSTDHNEKPDKELQDESEKTKEYLDEDLEEDAESESVKESDDDDKDK